MTSKATPTRLVTAEEAAERLGCSRRTVTRLCMSGQISFIPGRPVRIPEHEIEAYVERMLVRARPRESAPVTFPPVAEGPADTRPIKTGPIGEKASSEFAEVSLYRDRPGRICVKVSPNGRRRPRRKGRPPGIYKRLYPNNPELVDAMLRGEVNSLDVQRLGG